VLIIIIFFLVSIFFSMVGLGGGVIYVPLLLAFGYSFNESAAVSLFLITLTGFSAFSRYRKAKLVDWQLAFVMEVFTDIGAFLGGFTSVHFHEQYLKILFGFLLVATTILLLKSQNKKEVKKEPLINFGIWERNFNGTKYSVSIPLIIPVTLAIGYVAGLLGVSGGFLKVPVMTLWLGVPAKIAIATSSLMVGITGAVGLGGRLLHFPLNWELGIRLGIAVFIGGQIGSKISIGLSGKKNKAILALILLLVGVYMIFKSIF